MMLGYIDPGSGFTFFSAGSGLLALLLGFLGGAVVFLKKGGHFLRKHRRVVIYLLAVSVLFLVGYAMMQKKAGTFHRKVIILGFDGLSPQIIEPLMEQGKLVHFRKLAQDGSYHHLQTTNPAQSPVAWSGFATGKNPGEHGVFDFIIRNPKNYELSLSLSDVQAGRPRRVLKAKGFWSYTSRKKVPTVVLGCPMTFPPEKIFGKMLSGMGVPDILGTEGTFTFFTTENIAQENVSGGKIIPLRKGPVMVTHLLGPRVSALGKKIEAVKVPLKISLRDSEAIEIQYQGQKFTLKKGEWSSWKEIVFPLGFLRKIHGIAKFYLVAVEPSLQLYVSPINFDPRHSFYPISYPPGYAKELVADLGLYHTQGLPLDTWAVSEKKLSEAAFLEQVGDVFRERAALLELELNRFKEGVLYCYFGMPDTIQHMFWRYIDKDHKLYEKNAPAEYRQMINAWYEKMDDVLGVVGQHLGKDDIIIALSDHGFNSFHRAAHLNTWLKEKGYLALKDSALSGKPLLADVDWPRTKAYAVGFGGIYINQKGREKDGTVEPGTETEALKEKIAKELEGWRDKESNGVAVVRKVYKREEIFRGRHEKEMPDLYAGFEIGYEASWQTALGGAPSVLIEDNLKKWSGSHLFDPALVPGIIFVNREILKNNPSLYDLTPTILKITGYSDEEIKRLNFDGQPLF